MNNYEYLLKDINSIKGIGLKTSKLFKKKNINTVFDLIWSLPRDTIDRTNLVKINELQIGKIQTITIKVKKYNFPRIRNLPNRVFCEDDTGNQSFQKACPPGTHLVEKKKISVGKDTSKQVNLSKLNVVLYTIPECTTCEEVAIYLKSRDIPFNEKDVSKDIQLQQELTKKTGKLSVPVTVIGEEVVSGYNREKIGMILDGILSPE